MSRSCGPGEHEWERDYQLMDVADKPWVWTCQVCGREDIEP